MRLCLMLRPDGMHHVTGSIGHGRTHADQYTPPSSWLHRREIASCIGYWRDAATLGYGVDLDFQRRVALAGFRCDDVPRISVLKFPSSCWRNYAAGQTSSAAEFLRRIGDEAMLLERGLLKTSLYAACATKIARCPVQMCAERSLRSSGESRTATAAIAGRCPHTCSGGSSVFGDAIGRDGDCRPFREKGK